MHILVITTSYPTQANPASGIFIHRMLACLPRDIHVRVLAPEGRKTLLLPARQSNIRIQSFRYATRALQNLAHQPGGIPASLQHKPLRWLQVPLFCTAMLLATLRQAYHADLIHANWSLCGVIAGLAGRLRSIPVVTSIRGSDMAWAGRYLWCRWILKLCLVLNQEVVTVSAAMARQLAGWFPARRCKIDMIPNGVNQVPAHRPAVSSSVFTFVVIGNLIPLKNVDLIIRALAHLCRTHDNIELCVIGDGPEKGRLQQLSRSLGLDRQIHFKGQLPPEQVANYLARSHALILASAREGRPNVVLEAMAGGVPVIASEIDGVRELIDHEERGLLFSPGDLSQLVGHLERLLAQPDLGPRLAANARRWVVDQGLSWENTAARYVDLYGRVLSQHRRGKA